MGKESKRVLSDIHSIKKDKFRLLLDSWRVDLYFERMGLHSEKRNFEAFILRGLKKTPTHQKRCIGAIKFLKHYYFAASTLAANSASLTAKASVFAVNSASFAATASATAAALSASAFFLLAFAVSSFFM
jgi:hypothetical protein